MVALGVTEIVGFPCLTGFGGGSRLLELGLEGDAAPAIERDAKLNPPFKEPFRSYIMALKLRPDEQAWLEEFRQALEKEYVGLVEDMVVFYAQDSTLHLPVDTVNVAVKVKDNDNRRQVEKDISRLGHRLAVLSDAMPFIVVYTNSEWKRRQISDLLPYRNGEQSLWSTRM